MIKFEDRSILTGYIKELLHSFNLPTVEVYTEGTNLFDGGLYIKENSIVSYDAKNKLFKTICPFIYDTYLPYYTKNLKIENNIYDSHTHEYLGEYLRFIRDYKNLDLMSLYNCFSNRIVSLSDDEISSDLMVQLTGTPVYNLIPRKTYHWESTAAPEWDKSTFGEIGDFTDDYTYRLEIDDLTNIKYPENSNVNTQVIENNPSDPYHSWYDLPSFIGFKCVKKDNNKYEQLFILYDTKEHKMYKNFKGSFDFSYLGYKIKTSNDGQTRKVEVPEDKFLTWSNIKIILTKKINFWKTEGSYKIYSIPVKFFKDYTIAISCDTSYELVCGFYTKGLLKGNLNDNILHKLNANIEDDLLYLTGQTYKQVSYSNFELPYIYSNLNPSINSKYGDEQRKRLNTKFLREHEKDLRLFIKLPVNCTSSIVVLEGNYLDRNNRYIDKEYLYDIEHNKDYILVPNEGSQETKIYISKDAEGHITESLDPNGSNPLKECQDNGKRDKWKNNKTILNMKESYLDKPLSKSIVTSQTVKETKEIKVKIDGVTQTFTYDCISPKVIQEYSTAEHFIDSLKDIKLISNLQLLNFGADVSYPFADRLFEYLLDNAVTNIDDISDNIVRIQENLVKRYRDNIKEINGVKTPTKLGLKSYTYPGIWQDLYQAVLYEIASQEGLIDIQHDVLGYMDKDIEKYVDLNADIYKGE